jgi:hypothetical protein
MLELKEIHIDDLLLDPNNPRLRTAVGETVEAVGDQDVVKKQDEVLRRIHGDANDRYELRELIASMKMMGYLRIDRIVVRPLDGSGKYLVIEGNRRVSSAKLIVAEDDRETITNNRLSPRIRESLDRIEVQVLDVRDKTKERIAEDINTVLGLRHYGSLLEWGALPKAHNIFEEYMRTLPLKREFQFVNSRVNSVAEQLSIAKAAVVKALRAYRAFKKIESANAAIRPKHFSLVEEFVTNKSLCAGYISVDESTYLVDEESLARIIDLCEFDTRDRANVKPLIPTPQAVRALGRLYRMAQADDDNGTQQYAGARLLDIDEKICDVETAYAHARSFKKRRAWLESLSELLATQADQLKPSDFKAVGNAQFHKEELTDKLRRLKAVLDIG